jgi:hypothetical protein
MHVTDENLDGCMRITTTEKKPILKIVPAKAVSNISLMTDFV